MLAATENECKAIRARAEEHLTARREAAEKDIAQARAYARGQINRACEDALRRLL